MIDSHLGLRSTLIGYQYSEIIRAVFSVFCCGGDCMEDLNLYLKDVLTERYAGLYEKVKRQTGWTTVEIGFQQYDVQSFPFESFENVKHCRLVVQRQRKQNGEQLDLFDGEYTYRCILTNDWDMTDEEIILHYNKRGSAEQVFDLLNTKNPE